MGTDRNAYACTRPFANQITAYFNWLQYSQPLTCARLANKGDNLPGWNVKTEAVKDHCFWPIGVTEGHILEAYRGGCLVEMEWNVCVEAGWHVS